MSRIYSSVDINLEVQKPFKMVCVCKRTVQAFQFVEFNHLHIGFLISRIRKTDTSHLLYGFISVVLRPRLLNTVLVTPGIGQVSWHSVRMYHRDRN